MSDSWLSEDEPLLVTPIETEKMTHHDIEIAKGELIDEHLDIGPYGLELKGVKDKDISCIRRSCCFKTCIARNPRTPMNELHLIQPMLLLCIIFGSVLLILGPVIHRQSDKKTAGSALVLLIFSSVVLFVVGSIAHSIPSIEDQVIDLINDDKIVEQGKDKEINMAQEAEDLQALTLDLVKQTAKQRAAVKNMHTAFIVREKEFIRLRYKSKMMNIFWNAEQDLYQTALRRREHELRTGQISSPFQPIPPPNGALTIDELRAVIVNLRNRGDDIELLDDLLERVINKRFQVHSTPKDNSIPFWSQREWSYCQLIDLVIEEAHRIGRKDPSSRALLNEIGLVENDKTIKS
mmetsp:Transcript_20590/g.26674  ORF Transcript_20590/g.26674 Transcript_20590/m.26674 type:complete len:349 (-) Transcript_20590:348-1394(-)|eukprot:CAMPEP_0197296436 /NCGR_PEP_ID=MMETSP0890-20130614/38412_1 /TAXON_ID=44058 ORGANISM="Aureoumbra lagunensis, Strain CCMP1510" /NCGR_SAMPLE_ID=MMETSP0890 /ASSEMBLY_ACC=CAM_ASM_000533 /LENGTH=348 /DNA_ID=CAMNT_0042772993 /DNA_START=80 /DNA_END=1126 /DNA_ORIENTATION=-